MNGLTSPVMFSVAGGINQTAAPEVQGFDSPEGESKPVGSAYVIPPVLWMIVFLIGGYIGLRWVMED